MFRFADPIYLYLLVLIPVLALIRFLTYRNQKKRLRKFGDPKLLRELMPDVSRFRPVVKFWILLGALSLLIVIEIYRVCKSKHYGILLNIVIRSRISSRRARTATSAKG